MLLCDTHADTLYGRAMGRGENRDVTLEKLERGGVNAQTMALYVGGSAEIGKIRAAFEKMEKEKDALLQEGWKQLTDYRDAREGEAAFILSVEGCDLLENDLLEHKTVKSSVENNIESNETLLKKGRGRPKKIKTADEENKPKEGVLENKMRD